MAPNPINTATKTMLVQLPREPVNEPRQQKQTETKVHNTSKWIWLNIIAIVMFHTIGVFVLVTQAIYVKFLTVIWAGIIGIVGGFGVTGGAHRFWTHRTYKATFPLRCILIYCFCTAGQNSLFEWVRDHRVHHKHSETDADPHNSNRGFWFAHVGWLMQRKHPEVIIKGKQIDMSDVLEDPVVRFHQKYFLPMKLVCCFLIPSAVPYFFWNETLYNSVMALSIVRYMFSLNFTWLVNSAAHIWGTKPFDNRISPVENRTVALLALGEGWHNYHHVFPWDYKAAEMGSYSLNITTFLIDFFAYIGWAYDLKQPSKRLVREIGERYGDGTHGAWEEVSETEDQYHET